MFSLRLCHIAMRAADRLSSRQLDEASEKFRVLISCLDKNDSIVQTEPSTSLKSAISQSQLLCPASFSSFQSRKVYFNSENYVIPTLEI